MLETIFILFSAILAIFSYIAGKNKKENEILNNNAKVQKKINSKKPSINSVDDLYDKLQNGKF